MPAYTAHVSKYRSLMPSLALLFHLVEFPGRDLDDDALLRADRLLTAQVAHECRAPLAQHDACLPQGINPISPRSLWIDESALPTVWNPLRWWAAFSLPLMLVLKDQGSGQKWAGAPPVLVPCGLHGRRRPSRCAACDAGRPGGPAPGVASSIAVYW